MKISTAAPAFQPILRKIAEDPLSLSGYSSELQEKLKLKPNSTVALPLGGTLCLSGSLPPNFYRNGSKVDFESLKTKSQDFINVLKMIPGTGSFVTGVQVLWLFNDFFNEITEDEIDVTKVALTVTSILSDAADVILTYQGSPNAAKSFNVVAALAIATRDEVYIAHIPTNKI